MALLSKQGPSAMATQASTDSNNSAGSASEPYDQALERFTLLWGEMASNWGINRTMAQIHALLYASDEPLHTDAIMDRLQISRGNANMNLRSLVQWNLVQKTHRPDSRKDFYEAEKDVWQITTEIIKERQRRELGPLGEKLEAQRQELLTAADAEACADLPARERYLCERMTRMIHMMRVFDEFMDAFLPFLREEHAPLLRDLIGVARAMQETVQEDDALLDASLQALEPSGESSEA